ncbi:MULTISPECIES: cytochrome b [Vibrio diabolicus subgroup]|uniref:cytochrome b n=1 Tax=Vibrio diabolicus subgroup TaxID=2315253 RepID=UPI00080F559F|nr:MULTISPECIES: cytochrome b/b6 domain-containing protein [Vibrio diabolicus subgroup]EHR5764749.1 cytochrome b/b6 domain-containing protein [Vibrio parahaemolyticus]EHY0932713.1 cytochrome b/b6 domain-containing protein [Vibrio parahaemolyticus]EIZ0312346.1 cytochrome b/b6 domain-containing protein [Vibrio parahaemolyticus]EJE8515914.1 cytochrome b/b6 domain-containing protein [Vibrio parahaemolyticus]EJE8774710.1 cytochrome b/b6 domain-containing protein [Vibrio parahaemolyticus]
MLPNFDFITRAFHWIIAGATIYALIAGYVMLLVMDSHPNFFSFLSTLNMSLATLIFPLFVLRWVWKYFRPDVESESGSAKYHGLVKIAHSTLYLLMFIVFVSGFLMLKHHYDFFWLIEVPNLVSNENINDFFFLVHRYACILLSLFVLMHALAAFVHHFFLKDKVLLRMLGKA